MEDRRLALEPENRAVNIGLAQQHAGVVGQIARLKIIGAVNDDVVVFDDVERVLRPERKLVSVDPHMRIDVGQAVFGRIQFLSTDVLRAMQDLSLQIAVIDDVEIDQPQSPYARRRQIQAQGRTQSARADQKRARGLQFALTFQPDFGQNQVAVVASQFVFVQFGQFGQRLFYRDARAAGYRRDDADLVLLFDRGVFFLQVADVFVVDVDVDEVAQLAVGVEEVFPQIGKLRGQFVERFADLRRFDRDRRLAPGVLAQSCRDRNGWHDVFSSRSRQDLQDFSGFNSSMRKILKNLVNPVYVHCSMIIVSSSNCERSSRAVQARTSSAFPSRTETIR